MALRVEAEDAVIDDRFDEQLEANFQRVAGPGLRRLAFGGGMHRAIIVSGQLMCKSGAANAALSYSCVARHRPLPARMWDSGASRANQAHRRMRDGGRLRGESVLRKPAQNHYHARLTIGAEYYHVIHLSLIWSMEDKARLTILIDPAKKKAFEELCSSQDMTSSQMVRLLIRQYLEKHGVQLPTAERKKSGRH
jgi:hypothetical protein